MQAITNIVKSVKKNIFKFAKKPREIMIEITYKCNLKCKFCFNKISAKDSFKEEMDTITIKKVIDKIQRSGIKIIRFTGGEPLLRKDIFELFSYAKAKGMKIWLNTNGTLINKYNVAKIVHYVDNVLIPLNAYNSLAEKKLTGEDSFKKKLKAILLLNQKGIRYIRCGTIATKEIICNFSKMYSLIKRLNLSDWELFRPIPLTQKDLLLNNNDIALLVEKLLYIKEKEGKCYKIANAMPFCAYDPEKVKQVSLGAIFDDGHRRFVIDPYGQAKPMYYLLHPLGSILNKEIWELWDDIFMRKMRNLQIVPKECRTCRYLTICRGGSRVVSKIINGNYTSLDYLARPENG